MKMLIRGMEPMSGISLKSGTPKPYDMTKVNTEIPLAPSRNPEQPSMGFAGFSYNCSIDTWSTVKHIKEPFLAEVDLRDVMKNGKPESFIFSIVPIESSKKTA